MIIKNDKGITIIALMVTVIVIMILTSIAVYSGVSTVKYTKLMKVKAQMETMQTEINYWYQEYKNGNNDVLSYGTNTDIQTYSTTFATLGISDTSNYRLFSVDYINDTLGIEGINYDFLINIIDRKIILPYGITYDDKTYYTLEDFGIVNVQTNPISSVDFMLSYEKITSSRANIYVYNVNFSDDENKDVDINKYKIQYKLSSDEMWKTVKLLETTEYIADDGKAYNAYKISINTNGTYQVKVSLNDDTVSSEKSIDIINVLDS